MTKIQLTSSLKGLYYLLCIMPMVVFIMRMKDRMRVLVMDIIVAALCGFFAL
jgi:hypothetical protein